MTRCSLPARLVLCWALACSTGATADEAADSVGAAPGGLAALMGRLATSGGVRAPFRETKHLALLSEPIETEGVLYFAPPDRLARRTTRPGRSSVVVRGDRVALRDETGVQLLTLGSNELARHFVENFVVLLRGDLAGLRARYALAFQSEGETWELVLEPRSPAVRSVVESIRFGGRGVDLGVMETRETSGDRTLTAFHDVETGLAFSPDELAEIFSLEEGDGAP